MLRAVERLCAQKSQDRVNVTCRSYRLSEFWQARLHLVQISRWMQSILNCRSPDEVRSILQSNGLSLTMIPVEAIVLAGT